MHRGAKTASKEAISNRLLEKHRLLQGSGSQQKSPAYAAIPSYTNSQEAQLQQQLQEQTNLIQHHQMAREEEYCPGMVEQDIGAKQE